MRSAELNFYFSWQVSPNHSADSSESDNGEGNLTERPDNSEKKIQDLPEEPPPPAKPRSPTPQPSKLPDIAQVASRAGILQN